MFFTASKIAWFFAQPSNLILIVLAAGVLLLFLGRAVWGRRLAGGGVALYAVFGLSPAGHLLMLPLEERFPRAVLSADFKPAGVIVLGGAVDALVSGARGEAALNDAAERMTEAAALAAEYPEAKIVFSGGSAELIYNAEPETAAARRFFARMGVAPSRLVLESASRNTHENAQLTRDALGDADGEWLLVTSAFHMPRAMALFEKAGFRVRPWPVDYRTRGPEDVWRFFPRPSEGLRRTDLAVKEWIGLFIYWASGRTDSLFPRAATGEPS
ncbi:MAG: YdcF family protein [Hyphomicrobiales bacterium]|nr:YdcF family protein [Hyphomicrobiales bacterium]